MKNILFLSLLTFFNMACAVFNSYDEEDFKIQYPALYGLIEMDKNAMQEFVYYTSLLEKEKKIRRFRHVKEIFDYRDSFILQSLSANLEKNELYYEKLRDNLNQELKSLGIGIISAEGVYGDVGPLLFLNNKLKELAPKDFQLYQQFQHYNTLSKGSEYPFLDMMPEQEMIIIGEEFLKSDTTSRYWKYLKEDFYGALVTFFDMHLVINDDEESFIVGNTNTALWPFATNIIDRQDFISANPSSRITQPLKEFLNNISEIDVAADTLFLAVINWNKDYNTANNSRINYLLDSEDIPHLLEVKRQGGTTFYANVYRFYSDKNKAGKAITHIKKGHPNAELISVTDYNKLVLKEVY